MVTSLPFGFRCSGINLVSTFNVERAFLRELKVMSHNKLLNYTSYRIAHSTMAKWGPETTFMILAYIPVGEIIELSPLPRRTKRGTSTSTSTAGYIVGQVQRAEQVSIVWWILIINWCKTLLNHIRTGVGRYNYCQDKWGLNLSRANCEHRN